MPLTLEAKREYNRQHYLLRTKGISMSGGWNSKPRKTYHQPEYQILDEEDVVVGKVVGRLVTCFSCDQRVRKVEGRYPFHTRRVFRNMKNGKPDFVIEPCPNSDVESK